VNSSASSLDSVSHRGKVRELRESVRQARAALSARTRKVRAACRRYRRIARGRVRAWYRAELARLRQERDRRLAAVGDLCARKLAELREDQRLAEAERRVADYRRIRSALVAVRGGARKDANALRREHRQREREVREESDDRVRGDVEGIDRALLVVWEAVKRNIVAGPRKSRTEAFFQWCEENPGEVIAIQAKAGNVGARELVGELARQEREHLDAQREGAIRRLHCTARAGSVIVRRGGKVLAKFSAPGDKLGKVERKPRDPSDLSLAREAARRWLAEREEVPF
jgi:hypothetical protein